VGDEELQARLPAREGIVELRLKDGRTLRHHTQAVRGTAENPMSRDEVDEKCFHLIQPILGAQRGRQLCDAIWGLESVRDVRELRPLFGSLWSSD
jgi:2-methylcitrate dehydratase PrpD